MSKVAIAAVSCLAAFGLAAVPAGAVTVTSNTTMNCETGEGRPDGMGYDSSTKRFTAPFLSVSADARLSLTGAANPSACTVAITGDAVILGALDYNQRNPMERAGHMALTSGGTASIPGTVSANGASPLLSGDGGDGGIVVIRAPMLSITGTVAARGGDGANATGDDGGDAGSVVVIGDRGASLSGSTLVSVPGAGGGGLPPLIEPGSAGANQGTVRRNAHTGATGGTAIGSYTPVNQSPTGLTLTRNGSDKLLRWQDRSHEESGFAIVRRIGDGSAQIIATRPPNTTSFTDSSTLPAGSTTIYVVFATFPASVWPDAFAISNAVTLNTPGTGDSNGGSDGGSNGGPADPAATPAVPTAVAIRRALRSGRQLSVNAIVDRRLAGERVELLVGTGSTLLGRARLRVAANGRVAVSGTLPARVARARSLLVAIRTPATDKLLRETQIARTARMSPAVRATSGSRGRGRLTVSGRVRAALRGRVILTVRYLDGAGRLRVSRGAARRLRDRWQASVDVPRDARNGVVSVATRGDLRHYGQGLAARLPGS